mgnify:CR=1 FL=1
MNFYCDIYKVLLDFYDVCKHKELFDCFDILTDNGKLLRILLREDYLNIRDMRENRDLIYIKSPYIFCDGVLHIEDIKEIIKEYKEDSTSCILIRGRNLFPDCFKDFSEQERQKILVNMIIFLERIQNYQFK